MIKTITVLQDHLLKRTIPTRVICDRLATDRTAIYAWAHGRGFPHRLNARALILLFAEHGIELDYNDIYQQSLAVSNLEAAV